MLGVGEIAEKTITYHFQVFLEDENKLAAEGYLKCIAVNEDVEGRSTSK